MSEGSELSPEDVKEILRLIDESEFDEARAGETRRSAFASAVTGPVPTPEPTPTVLSGLVDVPAPVVGTVYRAPAPGEPPFVEVGSRVDRGRATLHHRGDEADEQHRGAARRQEWRRSASRMARQSGTGTSSSESSPMPDREIRLVDTTVRDGHQSLWSANALSTPMIAEIAPVLDRVGFHADRLHQLHPHGDGGSLAPGGSVGADSGRPRTLMPRDAGSASSPRACASSPWWRAPVDVMRLALRLRDPERCPPDLGGRVDERRRRPTSRSREIAKEEGAEEVVSSASSTRSAPSTPTTTTQSVRAPSPRALTSMS